MAFGDKPKPPQRRKNPQTGAPEVRQDGEWLPQPQNLPGLDADLNPTGSQQITPEDQVKQQDAGDEKDGAERKAMGEIRDNQQDEGDQPQAERVAAPAPMDATGEDGQAIPITGPAAERPHDSPSAAQTSLLAQILSELREMNRAGLTLKG